jgi:hypothetical protein
MTIDDLFEAQVPLTAGHPSPQPLGLPPDAQVMDRGVAALPKNPIRQREETRSNRSRGVATQRARMASFSSPNGIHSNGIGHNPILGTG